MLHGFLEETFCENVIKEIEGLDWYPKHNDLYTFFQSDDLKNCLQPNISKLRASLYSEEFRLFLEQVTGIKLNSTIDVSASRYIKGCHLLCHDDELEGRRIAYILYLVSKDWSRADGGTLDLYAVDEFGQPQEVTTSIVPICNSFLFFAVTPHSYHQVAEILAESKDRLSISGWFHGENIRRPPPYIEPPLPATEFSFTDTEQSEAANLSDWVNPIYLTEPMIQKMRRFFERESSIELKEFLVKEKFAALKNALKSLDAVAWQRVGPSHRRCYESLGRNGNDSENGVVKAFKHLLKSLAFTEWLSKVTSLELEKCFVEVRRFVPGRGHYTLAQDTKEDEMALDLFYNVFSVPEEYGGFVTYMSSDEELLTSEAKENTLALIYRAKGCMRFVKFLTAAAPECRCDYAGIYWEKENNRNNNNDNSSQEETNDELERKNNNFNEDAGVENEENDERFENSENSDQELQ